MLLNMFTLFFNAQNSKKITPKSDNIINLLPMFIKTGYKIWPVLSYGAGFAIFLARCNARAYVLEYTKVIKERNGKHRNLSNRPKRTKNDDYSGS